MLGGLKGPRLADLGAGAGFYSLFCLEHGAASGVLAVDACPEMLAQITDPRIEKLCADIGQFSVSEKFPCIVCAGALEFVSDPCAVLTAARKIADRNCVFCLLVPRLSFLSFFYFLFHLSHGIRVRLFSDADIVKLARKSGWRVRDSIRVFPFSSVFRLEPTEAGE